MGLEPTTFCVQSRRSSQLSYVPGPSILPGRPIGPGHPTYVIAEAGANHNRDMDIARRLIDVAADSVADAVKFQTYSGNRIYSRKTPMFDPM